MLSNLHPTEAHFLKTKNIHVTFVVRLIKMHSHDSTESIQHMFKQPVQWFHYICIPFRLFSPIHRLPRLSRATSLTMWFVVAMHCARLTIFIVPMHFFLRLLFSFRIWLKCANELNSDLLELWPKPINRCDKENKHYVCLNIMSDVQQKS